MDETGCRIDIACKVRDEPVGSEPSLGIGRQVIQVSGGSLEASGALLQTVSGVFPAYIREPIRRSLCGVGYEVSEARRDFACHGEAGTGHVHSRDDHAKKTRTDSHAADSPGTSLKRRRHSERAPASLAPASRRSDGCSAFPGVCHGGWRESWRSTENTLCRQSYRVNIRQGSL